MKTKTFVNEIVISVILLVLAITLLNPFGLWMPDMLTKMILVGLLVIFTIFAGLIWKEKASDERELLHAMLAGRLAFLAGVSVLVIGTIVQSLNHAIDPWLVGALGAMVLIKIIGLMYSQTKY